VAALPVETGHPETSRKFAARMRGCFWLQGPGPQRKGKSGATPSITEQLPPGVTEQSMITEHLLLNLVLLSSEGINLRNKFWDNYF
jgi:hypothetical protein